jgi:hypothetical protein
VDLGDAKAKEASTMPGRKRCTSASCCQVHADRAVERSSEAMQAAWQRGTLASNGGRGLGWTDLHDVVGVPFEDLHTLPSLQAKDDVSQTCAARDPPSAPHLVPVPQLDELVVRRGQQVRHRGMRGKAPARQSKADQAMLRPVCTTGITVAPDVVAMCFECFDLVHRVVTVHPDEHVVGATHHPLLSGHKLGSSHCAREGHLRDAGIQDTSLAPRVAHTRELGDFKRLNQCLNQGNGCRNEVKSCAERGTTWH